MHLFDVTKYKRVIIFTAHPDDLEGFMGGTVKLMAPTAEIHSIIFSEGDRGRWKGQYRHMHKHDFEELRVEEAEEAMDILDMDSVDTLEFDDRHIPVSADVSRLVNAYITKLQPDLILSFEYQRHRYLDPHPDHIAVAKNVYMAVSSIPNFAADYFVFTTLRPNYFVPIDSVLEAKYRALRCHTTQKQLNRILFFFLDRVPTRLWGILNHTGYAECYRKVVL